MAKVTIPHVVGTVKTNLCVCVWGGGGGGGGGGAGLIQSLSPCRAANQSMQVKNLEI